jgi:hypothetical protein
MGPGTYSRPGISEHPASGEADSIEELSTRAFFKRKRPTR